jgi:hypothetical protein
VTTIPCLSDLDDAVLQATYERAKNKLSPSLDPDERVRVWREVWALSSELQRRQYPETT